MKSDPPEEPDPEISPTPSEEQGIAPTPATPEPEAQAQAQAQRANRTRSLVVSIHDVSPLTFPQVERILTELDAMGVRGCSLLVVPNHHRRAHFLDDPQFCFWLQKRAALGDEIVIHGYVHLRERKQEETLTTKLATRVYTANEGEFFDIQGADALRLVSQARQEFKKLKIDPRGFIAPAWLLSEGGERALKALGIAYTTRLGSLEDIETGASYASQSLVWSVRSLWRRLASLCWNPVLYERLRRNPLLRIGIHPPDIDHPAVWRQILKLIRKSLEERSPVTYLGYLGALRTGRRSDPSK